MNDHDRSLGLAALAVSEPLTVSDARALDAHLMGCSSCGRAHAALALDNRRLRALVAPRPVTESTRADILRAVSRPRDRSLAPVLLAAALLLLLIAATAVSVGSRQPPLRTGFSGSWTAMNCATHSRSDETLRMDCAQWGDGAAILLEIGPGMPATIHVSTAGGGSCSGSGTPNTTPPQAADGTFLWISMPGPACNLIALGEDGASHLYLEPNGRRIWFDDDGDDWGLFWIRSK